MTAPALLDRQFSIVREDLHRYYDQLCGADRVDDILDQVIAELSDGAKVTTFLPVLAEREAAERIKASAGAEEATARKEILFADQRGSGRCQIAAALTQHIAGEQLFVRSVGLHPEDGIDPAVLHALRDRGLDTSRLMHAPITPRVSHRADVIVLMGIDEAPAVPGDRYVTWDIADPKGATPEALDALIDDVETNVRALLAELDVTAGA
nr:protein tyrosine phosphatase [Corynebacterium lactis]